MGSALDETLKDAEWALLHGKLGDAEAAYAEAEALASSDGEHAQVRAGQAQVRIRQQRFHEARSLLEEAVALFQEKVPPATWGNLGFTLDKLAEFDAALAAHRKCIAGHEQAHGKTHFRALRKYADAAYSLIGLGRLDEAEALLRSMVEGLARSSSREPLEYAKALSKLGYFLLRSRSDPDAALACFDLAEAQRDACTLRYPSGRVIHEGFPEEFAAMLHANRAAALRAKSGAT